MKMIRTDVLISCGSFVESQEWIAIQKEIHMGIAAVHWPPNSGKFTIRAELGKKRGMGNGVKPIKEGMMTALKAEGWELEKPLNLATRKMPGKLDAVRTTSFGPFAIEWETGNISSSHRALNKMAIGLLKQKLVGGILVVPSRDLYRFLTDRVGNVSELEPYYDVWRALPCQNGFLGVIVVEYDETSPDVPRITKGTDGRALA